MNNQIFLLFGIYFMRGVPFEFSGIIAGMKDRSFEDDWGKGYITDFSGHHSSLTVEAFDKESGELSFHKQYVHESHKDVLFYKMSFSSAYGCYVGTWWRPLADSEDDLYANGVAKCMVIPVGVPENFNVMPEGFGD